MFLIFILVCDYWYLGAGTSEEFVVWSEWKGLGTKADLYLLFPENSLPLRLSLEVNGAGILNYREIMTIHSFHFKIAFTRRSSKLEYYYGLSMDVFRFKFHGKSTGFLYTWGFFTDINLYTFQMGNTREVIYVSFSKFFLLKHYLKLGMGLRWYFPLRG
ncbi:hypothetical protein DRQ23_07375 [bacterium]|nr:MAG: hypothetical protein DRQ23_07375 [bacterium]